MFSLNIRLSGLLTDHIKKTLPLLQSQVRRKIKEKKDELTHLGGSSLGLFSTSSTSIDLNHKPSQGWLLLHLLQKFSHNYAAALDGIIPTSDPQSTFLYFFFFLNNF